MADLPLESPKKAYNWRRSGWLVGSLNTRFPVTLFEMLEVYAADYIEIGAAMGSISNSLPASLIPDDKLTEEEIAAFRGRLGEICNHCLRLDLTVCARLADESAAKCLKETPTYRQVKADIENLQKILRLTLDECLFLFISHNREKYYNRPPGMGPNRADPYVLPLEPVDGLGRSVQPFREVLKAFPSIEQDVREAGNCLALERPTAAVFHLMRITEAGLKATAKALGVAYSSNWGACISDIEQKGQPSSDQFFKEAVAYLRCVKNVWRNPTMHIERSYSEQQAESIFNAVQAFMRHLATRLSE